MIKLTDMQKAILTGKAVYNQLERKWHIDGTPRTSAWVTVRGMVRKGYIRLSYPTPHDMTIHLTATGHALAKRLEENT